MTRSHVTPYCPADNPPQQSVPLTVVILTRNEEANIRQCVHSVGWASQVVVVDSGSSDDTVKIARALNAEVVQQAWLGFSAQREFALRHSVVMNNWVYFVDADEWVSPELAAEIDFRIRSANHAAFSHRLRLIFQGRWIRHCGWYRGSWVVRLVDRRYTHYDGSEVGERARVNGQVGRLRHDIVDEDRKGFSSWLEKHVRYAELEALRRKRSKLSAGRHLRILPRDRQDTRPFLRALIKDVVYPAVPMKPVALFVYMYIARLGLLDGRAGLRFCFYHAWYEACVGVLAREGDVDSRNEQALAPSQRQRRLQSHGR